MSNGSRLLSTPLRPFLDTWSADTPARAVLRFGAWLRWPSGQGWRMRYPALLALELPYSVIPYSVRVLSGVRCTMLPSEAGPAPSWRGMACRWGQTSVAFRNFLAPDDSSPDAWMPFSLLALLPENDPPGPAPEAALLGSQFFLHHTELAISLRHGGIRFEPGTRRPTPSSDCGEISA